MADKKKKTKASKQETKKAKDVNLKAEKSTEEVKVAKKRTRSRGKKIKEAKKLIDPAKTYALTEAIKLAKKTSITSFVGNLEAHINVKKTGAFGQVKLPNFTGKTKKIVVADDKVLAQIKKGNIDFDVLLSTPKFMPKLLPFARVLGPKGLMPNPKNGTLIANPEKEAKKMQDSGIDVKTEKKAPIIHMVVGKLNQKEDELKENVEKLIEKIDPQNIEKLVLAATMGPGIKVKIAS